VALRGPSQSVYRVPDNSGDDTGARQHDYMRRSLDFGHRSAHPIVGEAVDVGMDRAVGGRQDTPRRLEAPGRRRRGLAERHPGERTLRDRDECRAGRSAANT
jgi:hypothetical protein